MKSYFILCNRLASLLVKSYPLKYPTVKDKLEQLFLPLKQFSKMVPIVWRSPLPIAFYIFSVSRRICKLADAGSANVWQGQSNNLHHSEFNVGLHSCQQLASLHFNEAHLSQLTPFPSLPYGRPPAPLLFFF